MRASLGQLTTRIVGRQRTSGVVVDAQPAAPGREPWRRAAISALTVWAASHLAYLIINLLNWRIAETPAPGLRHIFVAWQKWDAGHYLRIAEHGYQPQFELDRAFFPLYPMLIRAADFALPSGTLVAALAVSNLAAYGCLVMLHRLASHQFGAVSADRTIYYLVAFPTAFFLSAPYNHSLLLLCATVSLYAMRRGHWWLAGLCGALASGTRSVGVLLILPFAFEYLRQRGFRWRRIRWDALAAGLVPGGLIGYAGYCWVAFGDPLAFAHAQRFWYRGLDWPWNALWRTIREPFNWRPLDDLSVVNIMDFGAAVSFLVLLALCMFGPWRLDPDQVYLFVFGLAVVLLPLCTPADDTRPLISMARHVLDAVPAFIILGRIGEHPAFNRIYLMPAITLQALLLVLYMKYDWAG